MASILLTHGCPLSSGQRALVFYIIIIILQQLPDQKKKKWKEKLREISRYQTSSGFLKTIKSDAGNSQQLNQQKCFFYF